MRKPIVSLSLKKFSIAFEGQEFLQACNFDFPMGQNNRLVFKNDREKFFFYHALAQVEGITAGQYLINDEDVSQYSFEEFLPLRLNMGVGFSTRGLIHNRTLRQNLMLPLSYHKLVDKPEEWVNHCGEYFNLHGDFDKRPAEVSPSAQKSTLILRAFIHRPELVILDTPELLLSKNLQASLLQLIDDHRKDHGLKHLLFSTYDEDLSDCLADQNIILDKKRLNLVQIQKLKRLAL